MSQDLWKLPRLTVLWKGWRFAWKSAETLFHSPPTGPWKSLRRQVASTIPTAAWKTRAFAPRHLEFSKESAGRAQTRRPDRPRFPQLPQALLLRVVEGRLQKSWKPRPRAARRPPAVAATRTTMSVTHVPGPKCYPSARPFRRRLPAGVPKRRAYRADEHGLMKDPG